MTEDGKLKSKIIEFGLQSEIKLFNSVPITKIKSCFDRADVLYLSLKDNPTFRKTPIKTANLYVFRKTNYSINIG